MFWLMRNMLCGSYFFLTGVVLSEIGRRAALVIVGGEVDVHSLLTGRMRATA